VTPLLPQWCAGVAVGVRLISGASYVWGVLHDRARPNPFTWLAWGLTGLVALTVQVSASGVGGESFVLLAQGSTALVVFGLAVRQTGLRRYCTPLTLTCSVLAMAAVMLWWISAPAWAVLFAILADALAALPTFIKAYVTPHTEFPLTYLLSAFGMVITLGTLHRWTFLVAGFPLYLMAGNLLMGLLASRSHFSRATMPEVATAESDN
jgi:hypothetical protein